MDKILIVEDNQKDRELLKEILLSTKISYDIREAHSGKTALMEINKENPDLILLDMTGQDINGLEILNTLKKRVKQTGPVLLVSSSADEYDRMKGLELGVTDFINKPIIPKEVRVRVAVVMKLKKALDDAKWVTEETSAGIKLLYKELEKKNKELQKLDQLKSDFISKVSHELRTPLAIIRQGISIVSRKIIGEVNKEQEEVLKDTLEHVDRLLNIINDILDISKLEAKKLKLHKSKIDIIELIQKLINDFQAKAKSKDILLKADFPVAMCALHADKDKIIQVLTNLLGNALKFTPQGGRITITAKENEDFVEMAISDTGIGIAKEEIPHLFNKFEQFGKIDGSTEKGTGLGLAICEEIMKLHGGHIHAASELGKGSTFYFHIPKWEKPKAMCTKAIDRQLKSLRKEKKGKKLSVLFLCIENFERIAKTNSNKKAQQVLKEVLETTRKYLPHRQGTEAFCDEVRVMAVLPAVDEQETKEICQKIRENIFTGENCDRQHIEDVQLQFGIASHAKDGNNAQELMKAAGERIAHSMIDD